MTTNWRSRTVCSTVVNAVSSVYSYVLTYKSLGDTPNLFVGFVWISYEFFSQQYFENLEYCDGLLQCLRAVTELVVSSEVFVSISCKSCKQNNKYYSFVIQSTKRSDCVVIWVIIWHVPSQALWKKNCPELITIIIIIRHELQNYGMNKEQLDRISLQKLLKFCLKSSLPWFTISV